MKKILAMVPVLVVFLTGCFGPKYIPTHYFHEKHAMSVTVHSIPSPTHSDVNSHQYETDPFEKVSKGLASAERSIEQLKVFNQIDHTAIQKELEDSIKKRAEKIFMIDQDSKDLAVEVRIESWGWVVPGQGFLSSFTPYQLYFNGRAEVYDLQPAKKLIAYTNFRARENLTDRMSVSDTQRAITKVVADAAELVGEFLWRSDEKDK